VPEGEALAEANLYAVCELIAARAARPSTRRQYAGTFRRFCDALRAELGRPPANVHGHLFSDTDALPKMYEAWLQARDLRVRG
jgi:hypothetical protein